MGVSVVIGGRAAGVKGTIAMPEQELREQLYQSFKHRSILYYLIFDVMREEVGQEKAVAMLKRAIYRRGEQLGQKFAKYAPDDLLGLKEAFLAAIPDEGRMFEPEVERSDDKALDIRFARCPLREAWKEAGLSDDEVALMCEIASVVDAGTFEAAGFTFAIDTWHPGGDSCCHLHIRPGK